MKLLDAHTMLSSPPPPMRWAVDGLLPAGVVADIFGPPGAGKSTLLLDLALAVAADTAHWHGRALGIGGPVVILGGERSDAAAFARDLHRAGRPAPPPGALLLPTTDAGDSPPLWSWNRRAMDGAGVWEPTPWGHRVIGWLTAARPAAVIIDTVLSAAAGCDLLDQPQQYALGQTIRAWGREVGGPAVLTVSHTNQASGGSGVALRDRLDYMSRAGGNGFPGALRHLGGVTKIRHGEVPGVEPATDRTLFAFGFSKHNESPPTAWTHYSPAIFSQKSGRIDLVMSGDQVEVALIEAEARAEKKNGGGGAARNSYRDAKDGANHAPF